MLKNMTYQQFEDHMIFMDGSNSIFDIPNFNVDIVQESYVQPSNFEEGQVWKCLFPYMDFSNRYKGRWGVIIDYSGKKYVVMASSCDETEEEKRKKKENDIRTKEEKVLEFPFNVIMDDWKLEGFNMRSFTAGSVFLPVECVKFEKLLGKLTKADLDKCKRGIDYFEENKFSSPWLFIDWMKNNIVKKDTTDSSSKKVRSCNDIVHDKICSNLDIAISLHEVCKKSRINHFIGWIKYRKLTGEEFDYLFTVVYTKSKSYAFRFMVSENEYPKMEITVYKNTQIDDIIKKENQFYKPFFNKIFKEDKSTYAIIEKSEMHWLDFLLSKNSIEKDVMSQLDAEKFPLWFYHMVPKGTPAITEGLLSPFALAKSGNINAAYAALDKYRDRMCGGWNIYPGRDPKSLTLEELLEGLEKFRGKGGSRTIYFFKYPPVAKLGKNMASILKEKDIYRINIKNISLNNYIENIDWGHVGSNTDNPALDYLFYRNVTKSEYFSKYIDNPKDSTPLFAPIPHIGITFKDGICPDAYLDTVMLAGKKLPDVVIEQTTLPAYVPEGAINLGKSEDGSYDYRFSDWPFIATTMNDEQRGHFGVFTEEYKGISPSEFKRNKNSMNGYAVLKLAIHGDSDTEKMVHLHRDKESGKITFEIDGENKEEIQNRWIRWANGYSDTLKFKIKGNEVTFERKDGEPLKESIEESEDMDVVTEAAKPKEFKTFKEFCAIYETPEEVIDYLARIGAHWPTEKETNKAGWKDPNDKAFTWPEEMISTKRPKAICFDYAVFFHYYFKERKVENHVLMLGILNDRTGKHEKDKRYMFGHGVCTFRRKEGWYIVDYHAAPYNKRKDQIIGPMQNEDDLCALYTLSAKKNIEKQYPKCKWLHYYHLQSEDDMRRYYDSNYGTDMPQNKLFYDELGHFLSPAIGELLNNHGKSELWALPMKPIWSVIDITHKVSSMFESSTIEAFEEIKRMAESLTVVTEATEAVDPDVEISNEEPSSEGLTNMNGIVDLVLHDLGDKVDTKKFSEFKTGKKFMYTRCKVMQKFIPLVIFLAYCEGLTTVMKKAGVNFEFSDKRPRLTPMELSYKGVIPFSDGYLIYQKYPLHISLLMNGLIVMNTKCIEYADMDEKDTYADLFDMVYGARMLGNALGNFYDLMIDSVTREVLADMNYPTEFVELMLAGNKLLADNNYVNELDMKNWRIRNNEQVYAHAYKKVADAFAHYKATADNKNPAKISIPRDAVIKEITKSQIVEDQAELSPIVTVKKAHICTDKGPSGTNLEESYTMARRCYHPSMVGVIAMSTSPDGNVGIQRSLTLEPNVINARGYVLSEDKRQESECNLFSMEELLSPGGATEDDQIRSAMSSKQASHVIPVESAGPVLMSNGSEKVIPYHLPNDFSVVAKDDGEVVEWDEKTGVVILKYKNLKGDDATQVIDMNTKVVKNGAGGFFLTSHMDCSKLKKGMKFKKNEVLAYNSRFFSDSKSEGVRFNIGTLAKIACVATYANFEDADFITDKLSKKMGSEICMEITAIVGLNSNVDYIVKKGQEVNVNDPLIIYDQSSQDASFNKMLAHIGKELNEEITGMGKIPIKSKYAGVVQDIKIYSTVETEDMSPSLRKIVESYYSEIRARERVIRKHVKGDRTNSFEFMEKAEPIEPTDDGKIMGIKVGAGVLFRFFIKYQDYMDIGDKLVHFAAIKCVNGEMIPKGLEPYSIEHPEEEISSSFAPAAVLARMVPSILKTMYGNKVIVELKRKWLEMYMKDNPNFKPKDELY